MWNRWPTGICYIAQDVNIFSNLLGIWLLFSAELVSAIQQCESAIRVHISLSSWASHPPPLFSPPLGHHGAPTWAPCAIHSFSLAVYIDMVVYMCQCPVCPTLLFPSWVHKSILYVCVSIHILRCLMNQALGPGALGRPRRIGWRGRWEGESGWGNTCKPMAVSFQCMTKSTTIKKKKLKKIRCLWIFNSKPKNF